MTDPPAKITILGSTGSIGTQALKVCEKLGLPIAQLTAGRNAALLERQARAFSPARVAVTDRAAYETLKIALADTGVRVLFGAQALCEAAACPDSGTVLNAVVGMAGLEPTLHALRAGKTLALANKESLVAGGELVKETLRTHGGALLPVDSEHNAIFQCLKGNDKREARRILLTASGGPFYGRAREDLRDVTVEEALRHPNWSMGAKITIDSATMMNKGLEVIEAMVLFGFSEERIEVLIHRESIVHSAVEYADGGILAQLAVPDMALPIQEALTYPAHIRTDLVEPLDLLRIGTLTFAPPDEKTFGCLALAREAARRGGLAPCVLNAANEEAVALFLGRRIRFLDIEEMVGGALDAVPAPQYGSLDEVRHAEQAAREYVSKKEGTLRR